MIFRACSNVVSDLIHVNGAASTSSDLCYVTNNAKDNFNGCTHSQFACIRSDMDHNIAACTKIT